MPPGVAIALAKNVTGLGLVGKTAPGGFPTPQCDRLHCRAWPGPAALQCGCSGYCGRHQVACKGALLYTKE